VPVPARPRRLRLGCPDRDHQQGRRARHSGRRRPCRRIQAPAGRDPVRVQLGPAEPATGGVTACRFQ
jgi:hypothetical protein